MLQMEQFLLILEANQQSSIGVPGLTRTSNAYTLAPFVCLFGSKVKTGNVDSTVLYSKDDTNKK